MSIKLVNSKKKPQEVCSIVESLAVKKNLGYIKTQTEYYLDGKWDFLPDTKDEFYQIKVPSSWHLIEQFDHPENFKGVKTAWYHYAFDVEEISDEDDLFLYFGAVSTVCNVYLNGTLLGYHGGRYTPFSFDINDCLRIGTNHLVVSVGDMSHALVDGGKGLVHQVGLMILNGHMPDPFMPDHHDFGGIVREVYVNSKPKVRAEKVRIVTSVKNKEIKIDFVTNSDINEDDLNIEITDLKGNKQELSFEIETKDNHVTATAKWENPNLWSPDFPNLYYMSLSVKGRICEKIRFGFREIEIVGDTIRLNGKGIRLFGESLNLSNHILLSGNRKEYSRLLFQTLKKEVNINCLRVHSMVGPKNMIDAADEVGMLILSQSGLWSSAGQYYNHSHDELLANVKTEFNEWIWRDVNSPSIIVWDAENELMRGSRANPWPMMLDDIIQKIDTTRPIVHSGSGGLWKKCSMYHLHHNEHYQYIAEKWQGDRDKPLMIGEWWIGGRAGTPRNITGLDNKLYNIFESTKSDLYYERIVELRNFGVSGVMPYSFLNYLFYPIFDYRQRVEFTSENMQACPDFLTAYSDSIGLGKELVNPNWDLSRPKYIMSSTMQKALKEGFAPVATFLKNRNKYLKSGKVTKTLCLFNDSEYDQDVDVEVSLVYTFESETQGFTQHLKQGEQLEVIVAFDIPKVTSDTAVDIEVVTKQHGIQIHKDTTSYLIMAEKVKEIPQNIALYDTKGDSAKILDFVNAPYKKISKEELETIDKTDYKLLIIGAYSVDDYVDQNSQVVEKFVKNGSKVWVMEQEKASEIINYPLSLISAIAQTTADFYDIGEHEPLHNGLNYSKYLPIYDPKHPIFADIGRSVSYFDNKDNRVIDNVYAKPLTVCNSVRNMKVISGGTKQEHCSAMEFFEGDGLYLFTQYKLAENAENDPMAKRILQNILAYLTKENSLKTMQIQVLGAETFETLLKKNPDVYIPYSDENSSEIIIIGSEVDYDSDLEQKFESFVKSGGTLLVAPRNKECDFKVFGNHIVTEKDYHSNSIFFHNDDKIVSGMYGTDFELDGITRKFKYKRDETYPVHYTIRMNDIYDETNTIDANTWYPLAELIYKNKTFWWYNAPKANNGYGAVAVKAGKGRVVLWQIDLAIDTKFSCFFTSTLLTNLGVKVNTPSTQTDSLEIIYLNDLEIDADISKWINDMEDDNVTRYRHAGSVLMMTQQISSGKIYSNVQCSGLVYFMYDKNYLYCLAQVVENHAVSDGNSTGVNVTLGEKEISIRLNEDKTLAVKLNADEISEKCKSIWTNITQNSFASNIDASRICAGILEPYYGGYIAEVAIPLDEIPGGLEKSFELDAEIHHTNEDGSLSILKYSHNKKNKFIAVTE